jgi:hypothetical protein
MVRSKALAERQVPAKMRVAAQVSSNIADGATQTGSASSQVLSAAQFLARDSKCLKLEVGKFLNSVRVA